MGKLDFVMEFETRKSIEKNNLCSTVVMRGHKQEHTAMASDSVVVNKILPSRYALGYYDQYVRFCRS